MSWRPARFTDHIPEQPVIHKEILSASLLSGLRSAAAGLWLSPSPVPARARRRGPAEHHRALLGTCDLCPALRRSADPSLTQRGWPGMGKEVLAEDGLLSV